MNQHLSFKRWTRSGNNFPLLLLASVFCCLFLLIRMSFSGEFRFIFLVWNLFLAWIPWWISSFVSKQKLPQAALFPLLMLWLLFFPNAPYIITDLFHLHPRQGVPQWMDLCLIFAFAWTGLWLGFDSLRTLQLHIFSQWKPTISRVAVPLVMFLAAYGVYLGRYLRFNSWDIATHPWELLTIAFDPLFDPFANDGAIGFSLLFGGMLLFMYMSFLGWGRGIQKENQAA